MTDFEPQSKAAKQLEWNTYGGWSSNESLIHDPEFVNDTPVTMTNNERPKRRNTRIEKPNTFIAAKFDTTYENCRSNGMEGKSGHLLNVSKRGAGTGGGELSSW